MIFARFYKDPPEILPAGESSDGKMEPSPLGIILSQPAAVLLCFSMGALISLKILMFILYNLYIFVLRREKNLRDYGKWAVITGPTDGIGRAMAFELAYRGFNLILVGRNPEKMDKVSKDLKAEVKDLGLKKVLMDFSDDIREGVKALEAAVEGVEVGILVNNAGVTQVMPLFLHEICEEDWWNIVKVNLVAPTLITSAVLPGMFKRKKGAIVNIGSAASVIVPSYPLFSVYAATKRYISHLSKSLHVEYKRCGIDIQCQVPGYVATKMIPRAKSSFLVATIAQYVNSAMRFIGYESHCMPYWTHAIFYYILQLCPSDAFLDSRRYTLATNARRKRKG